MTTPVTMPQLTRFWLPLQATWLMMAVEGPFLAAVIARLPDPKYNLAAYGVAFALAILVEAPVIMMMSAATALVDGRENYFALRRFVWRLNLGITLAMLALVFTPAWDLLTERLMRLDPRVARLAHTSLIVLLCYAGLSSIPDAYYQAAHIDGASRWAVFRYIQLPKMKRVLTIAILLRFMDSFMIYTEPFVLTGGGPGNTTTFVSIDLVKIALGQFDLGPAAAMSLIYFLVVLLICWVFYAVMMRNEER